MKYYFYKSCRILLIFLLCFSGMVYAQTGNSAWNKSWGATTPQKDAVMSLDLNVSEKKNLNPYNDGALCNGFMSVYVVEPSGRKSLLVTYEFSLTRMEGNIAYLKFVPGRSGMDDGEGTCKAILKNGKLQLIGTDQGGKSALFNGLTFK